MTELSADFPRRVTVRGYTFDFCLGQTWRGRDCPNITICGDTVSVTLLLGVMPPRLPAQHVIDHRAAMIKAGYEPPSEDPFDQEWPAGTLIVAVWREFHEVMVGPGARQLKEVTEDLTPLARKEVREILRHFETLSDFAFFPAKSRSSHTLYRFFDHDDDLLYVGITKNPGQRLGQHKSNKEWWEAIARVEMEHFTDRKALREAEVRAIRTENPRYNIADRPLGASA